MLKYPTPQTILFEEFVEGSMVAFIAVVAFLQLAAVQTKMVDKPLATKYTPEQIKQACARIPVLTPPDNVKPYLQRLSGNDPLPRTFNKGFGAWLNKLAKYADALSEHTTAELAIVEKMKKTAKNTDDVVDQLKKAEQLATKIKEISEELGSVSVAFDYLSEGRMLGMATNCGFLTEEKYQKLANAIMVATKNFGVLTEVVTDIVKVYSDE